MVGAIELEATERGAGVAGAQCRIPSPRASATPVTRVRIRTLTRDGGEKSLTLEVVSKLSKVALARMQSDCLFGCVDESREKAALVDQGQCCAAYPCKPLAAENMKRVGVDLTSKQDHVLQQLNPLLE